MLVSSECVSRDFVLFASVMDIEPGIVCKNVLTVNLSITFCAVTNMSLTQLVKLPLVLVRVLLMMCQLLLD